MSERNRFLKSGAMLTAVALAMRTVGMLFGAFVSRSVGAEGTGLYTIVMTVYSFALTFASSGVSLTVTRLVASALGENRPREIGRIMRGATLYALVFGGAASLLLFFLAGSVGSLVLLDTRTVLSLKILSFSLLPVALGSVISGYFVGVKRVGNNALVQVLGQLVKIGVTVLLVSRAVPYGTAASVAALCLGISTTEILSFLIIYAQYLLDRRKHRAGSDRGSAIGEVAKTALPLGFSAYVRSLLLNVEHILIPKKLLERGESTGEAYAHYGSLHGMALPLILYPMTPLSSFAGLLVPEFAEDLSGGRTERMRRVASEALSSTLKYAVLFAVLLSLFAEELGYAVYGSYDAGCYISMLAPIVPIMYLDHVADAMLKGVGEQVYSMWVNISDSLLSVGLVWLLIPRLGIAGYAVVIVIMEGYNFVLSALRLYKRVRFSIDPVDAILFPFISSLLAALLSRALFRFGGSGESGVWIAAKLVFAISVFVLLSTLFGALKHKRTEHPKTD